MATCLIALGSNLGERAAILGSAIRALDTITGIDIASCSRWCPTLPMGYTGSVREFLNGAALFETTREPDDLHRILQQIEADHGRQRLRRGDDRTLDLDLLLFDQCVIDTPSLTVPHPRMSFRRFVLDPATEIAGQWIHPTIGWTLERLRNHLHAAADRLAIVSPSEQIRRELATTIAERCHAAVIPPATAPDAGRRWPVAATGWIAMPVEAQAHGLPRGGQESSETASNDSTADAAKLTILLDPPTSAAGQGKLVFTDRVAADWVAADWAAADWIAVADQPGRGPTLRIPPSGQEDVLLEAMAAVETVWPGLCPTADRRLE